MPIAVELIDEQSNEPIDAVRWVEFITAVLADLDLAHDVELSIRFVDAPTIAELNERFLSHEGPTDVLSFPIEDDEIFDTAAGNTSVASDGFPGIDSAPLLLGDLVICPQVAAQQAPDHGTTYIDELALLITHGILHLIGMDHEVDDEAEAMEQRERELLAQWHHSDSKGVS